MVNGEPGIVDWRILLATGEKAVAWLKDHAGMIPSVSALFGLFLYAGTLRYYDSVVREIGAPGVPIKIDQGQTLARAAIGSLIIVSFFLFLYFAYETSRECSLERSSRLMPFVLFVGGPIVPGLALGTGAHGAPVALYLVVWGLFALLACLLGVVVGLQARRMAQGVAHGLNAEHAPEIENGPAAEPLPLAIRRRLSVGWIPFAIGIGLVSVWAQVDRFAHDDVDAIRKGYRQDDLYLYSG